MSKVLFFVFQFSGVASVIQYIHTKGEQRSYKPQESIFFFHLAPILSYWRYCYITTIVKFFVKQGKGRLLQNSLLFPHKLSSLSTRQSIICTLCHYSWFSWAGITNEQQWGIGLVIHYVVTYLKNRRFPLLQCSFDTAQYIFKLRKTCSDKLNIWTIRDAEGMAWNIFMIIEIPPQKFIFGKKTWWEE